VTPGFNPTVVDYCVKNRIPVYPGINNPMGVEAALERGLTVLKFFPSEASGGIRMIQALAGPYVGVKYIPTGGVTPANLPAYLKEPAVYAVGGTWIARADLISAGKFEEVAALAREAVAVAAGK
jgi:2-dehydro-3-deoxyphosphogluconate aldolase/(4S)-4-hydroxy-2-oxoglutarate aldolase